MRDLIILLIIFGSLPLVLMRPWLGVLLWYWISIMNPHKLTFGIAQNMPVAMSVGLITIAGFIFTKDKKKPPLTRELILLGLLFLHFTITTIFAWAPDEAWGHWEKVFKILLITIIAMFLIYGQKKINWLIYVAIGSLAFYGIKGGIFSILSGGSFKIWGPPGSFIEGNNEIGLALIMALPFMFAFAQKANAKWLKNVLIGSAGLIAISIIFTYSRGAFLGLSVIGFFMFFASKRKGLILVILIPTLLVGFTLLPDKWFGRTETIQTYEQDDSAMQRIQAWGVSLNIALEKPLIGGGFQLFHIQDSVWLSYANFLGDWNNRARASHSIYFQVLGQHGFVGLFLFLLLLVGTILKARWLIKTSRENEELKWIEGYARALQMSLIGYAVSGAFLSLAYFDLFYLYVAFSVILTREVLEFQLKNKKQENANVE